MSTQIKNPPTDASNRQPDSARELVLRLRHELLQAPASDSFPEVDKQSLIQVADDLLSLSDERLASVIDEAYAIEGLRALLSRFTGERTTDQSAQPTVSISPSYIRATEQQGKPEEKDPKKGGFYMRWYERDPIEGSVIDSTFFDGTDELEALRWLSEEELCLPSFLHCARAIVGLYVRVSKSPEFAVSRLYVISGTGADFRAEVVSP